MKVIPINQISFRTFPIEENEAGIELTEQQVNDFLTNKIMFDKDLKTLIPFSLKEASNNDSEN